MRRAWRMGLKSGLVVIAAFLALVTVSGVHGQPKGAVKLQRCNFSVASQTVDMTLEDVAALAGLQFVNAQGGVGLLERADFAGPYVTNDTYQLFNPVEPVPLESYAEIEALNSYLRLNETLFAYSALKLILRENNTLEVTDGATLAMANSNLKLVKNNWLYLTNGATLALTDSQLNFTDYFSWFVDNGAVTINATSVALSDVLTFFGGSSLTINRSSFWVGSAGTPAPGGFKGKAAPTFFASNSSITAVKTSLIFQDIPLVHFSDCSLNLINSTVTLRNTTAHFYADVINFQNSEILAYDSNIIWHANTTALLPVTDVKAYTATAPGGTPANTTALIGFPLGAVDIELVDSTVDIEMYPPIAELP